MKGNTCTLMRGRAWGSCQIANACMVKTECAHPEVKPSTQEFIRLRGECGGAGVLDNIARSPLQIIDADNGER